MTDSKLYTVILEYNGGTYISQASGNSPAAALPKWISKLHDEEMAKWKITRGELTRVIRTDEPCPISGCVGVWCVTGSTKAGLVLIHLIATDESVGA